MTILEAIILGIVEGITEYLPISSTGHLIITQFFLGMEKSDAIDAFSVCIQGGAILAVLGLYFPRVKQMLMGLRGKDKAGLQLLINIIVAFLPAAVLGFIFSSHIKAFLFNATTVAITLAIGGIVILLFSQHRRKKGKEFDGKSIEELSWKGALGVGFMQCIAMCPGVSRSLMTMLGGLTMGLSMIAAVEFSFLLGLLTLTAATAYDAYKYGGAMVTDIGWTAIAVGTITAWLSAILAVKWLVGYLQRRGLSIFGWYRIAMGLVMAALIFSGAQLIADDAEQSPTEATSSTATKTAQN